MKANLLFTCRARSGREQRASLVQRAIVEEGDLAPSESIDMLAVTAIEPSRPRWKKRILLVDDDEQVLKSVALALESERYDVILAGNGYEAVAQCQRYRPDLIVIDLNMPVKDGWATLESVELLRPLMPMIVITARPLQYERAIAFGVDALMEKPLDFPLLLGEIERLLGEPAHKRLARLTDPNFKTVKLGSAGAKD